MDIACAEERASAQSEKLCGEQGDLADMDCEIGAPVSDEQLSFRDALIR